MDEMIRDLRREMAETAFLQAILRRDKVVLEVTVDLDAMPGAMHFGEYTADYVQRMLQEFIPHYNPAVKIIRNDRPEE